MIYHDDSIEILDSQIAAPQPVIARDVGMLLPL